jgi:hypothetical protein
MATHRIPILGANTIPDTSGKVFQDLISNQDTHANVKNQLAMVMDAPATAGDVGFFGTFKVPKNYVGSEKIVVTGTYNDDPTSLVSTWAIELIALADNESIDTAYEAADAVSESTWTDYVDEDMIEVSITLTVTLAVDDTVFYHFFLDDTTDTQSVSFLLTALEFEYADA